MAEFTFDVVSTAEVQATSCNDCKSRKLKCNRQLPCSNCARKSLQCTYSQNPKGSSKRKRNEADSGKPPAAQALSRLSDEHYEAFDCSSGTVVSGEPHYSATSVTNSSMRSPTMASTGPLNDASAGMPMWEWNPALGCDLIEDPMYTNPNISTQFARQNGLFTLSASTPSDDFNFSPFAGDLGWLGQSSIGSSELSMQASSPLNSNSCRLVDQLPLAAWPSIETIWPRQIHHHLLVKITSLYLRQIHPSIPLFEASDVLDGLNNGRYRTDHHFGAMILGLCTFTLVQQQEPNSLLLSNDILMPSDFLRETIALRQSKDVDENPSLECVFTDIYLFGALELLGKKNAAWLKLQEAITLAEVLDFTNPNHRHDDNSKEWERQSRLHVCLVIIERAYTFGQWRRISVPNVHPRTLQKFSQLSLKEHVLKDETEGNNISVLNLMAKTFDCLEGDLIYCWDGSCEIQHGRKCHKLSSERILGLLRRVPGPDHQDWLKLAETREKKVAQKTDNSTTSDENERGDVLLTCLWVLNRLWHLALIHGHISRDNPARELRPSFSIWLASEALAVVKSFTINGLELHGAGLALKMFNIASDFLHTAYCPLSIESMETGALLGSRSEHDLDLTLQHAHHGSNSASDSTLDVMQGNEPDIPLSNTDIANGFLGFFALFKNGKHAYLQDYLGIYKQSISGLR